MESYVEKLVNQWKGMVDIAKQMKELAQSVLQKPASEHSRKYYEALFEKYDNQERCAQNGLDLYHAKYANLPAVQPVYVFPRKVA